MRIEEIEEILGRLRIPRPQHIIIVHEPVSEKINGYVFYRGLAERFSDTIVLTADMRADTVIHETLHSLGLGSEILTQLAANILLLRAKIPSLFSRKPKYEICRGCERFKILHEKYAGRATHYVRVE